MYVAYYASIIEYGMSDDNDQLMECSKAICNWGPHYTLDKRKTEKVQQKAICILPQLYDRRGWVATSLLHLLYFSVIESI